jgi:D-arabinose 1-dehydrogenase-like Zn-dependent alcohol dehydrogenase
MRRRADARDADHRVGKPLELRDYPTLEPTGEQVLVRVESAGVCHSDVHIWDGYFDLGGGTR